MDITITAQKSRKTGTAAQALLDSGANGIFIDRTWAEKQGLPLNKLERPIPVFNVDGTANRAGDITHTVDVKINFRGHNEAVRCEVTDLGSHSIILGYTWLEHHNPEINWKTGDIKLS